MTFSLDTKILITLAISEPQLKEIGELGHSEHRRLHQKHPFRKGSQETAMTCSAVEKRAMQRLRKKSGKPFLGGTKAESFLCLAGHVEVIVFASVNMDSHMRSGKQHGEISVHSKSPQGTRQQTRLNSLNLTLVFEKRMSVGSDNVT